MNRFPIRFALNASETRSKKITNETIVNMYPEKTPDGGLSDFVLYQCSGLSDYCNTGDDPILALHMIDGTVYAVTIHALYKIDATKTVTQVGTFLASGLVGDRVCTADNGYQLVIVDGIRGFVYNIQTNTLTEITSQTGFYPTNTVTFQDGYFIFNRKGTGQFFISSLYDIATDPLDFATAEASPDDTVSLISFANQLWLFGEKTTEVWYNSGDALFPFNRVGGAIIQRGCNSPYSVCKGANTLYFIGDDNIVYGLQPNSYIPQRVSGYSVEKDIQNEPNAYGFVFAEYGHEFYMLHLPNSQKTWCYDVTSGSWHERRSPKLSRFDLVTENERHLSNAFCYGYGLKLIGSRNDGKVYYIDRTVFTEGGLPMVRQAISAPIFSNNQWLYCSLFELFAEVNITTNLNPKAILQWSDDGVKWSDGVFIDLGKVGERLKRFIVRRLGRFRSRTFKLTITDAVNVIIIGAYVEGTKE